MSKRLLFFCILPLFLSTSTFAQSVYLQSDDTSFSPYISLQRVSRNEDVESAFQQCRGSKDLNTKALSCSFVIERSKNRSQVERAYNSRGLANMALKNYSNAVQDFTHAMDLDKANTGYVDNRQGAFGRRKSCDAIGSVACIRLSLARSHLRWNETIRRCNP